MLDLNYDFTTEAQSKELIRLGVPEWTANCFMLRDDEHQMVYQVPRPYNYTQWKEWGAKKCGDEVIPIWTSGRLIEIYATCTDCSLFELPLEDSLIGTLIDGIEWNRLDFSKLED